MRRLLALLFLCGCGGSSSGPIERFVALRAAAFESLSVQALGQTVAQSYYQDCLDRDARIASLSGLIEGAVSCKVRKREILTVFESGYQPYARFSVVWSLEVERGSGTTFEDFSEELWIFKEDGSWLEWGDQTCP